MGVDIFLVISGFLIVSILLHKKNQSDYRLVNTLQYFYVSRFKRIAPAYFAMLVVVSLLAAVLFLPQDLAIYKKSLNQAAWFNSNNYFADFGDYFAPSSHEQPLLHTWSLAVEIHFYLLAPLLVLLLPVKALKWLFATMLLGFTCVAEYRLRVLGIEQATYYSLYARLPEFFAGALVALHLYAGKAANENKPWLNKLGMVLIIVAATLQPQLGPFPGLLALLPVVGAVLVLLHPVQGGVGRVLASKPLVLLGELSYSLYLWHWPVLALLRYYTGTQVLDVPFSLLFIALTWLLACLSFYWVEIPLRSSKLPRLRKMLGYGLLAGSVLGVGVSIAKINQVLSPPPLPIEYQRYADPATICHGQMVGDCLKGDLNSDKEVLVLGDSHAAMLNLFFDQLGKELGFKARIITASSCVTIPGFDYQRIAEWAHKPCLEQIEQAKKYLPQTKVLFLAASWNWQFASEAFKNTLTDFLKEQNHASKEIYFLEQEPLLKNNPLRAIRFRALGLDPEMEVDQAYQQANNIIRNYSKEYPNVISLNFEYSGVFEKIPFVDGVPIYFDDNHLNEEGAKRYALVARSSFRKILAGIF